ncbi:PSF2 [Prunus dulcis]|uniref:PSF2 n=3 Tax=Prunus dulcis TaxID=3755 RepID=A0A4Y1R1K4_PRUDU|nr:PSF2 [Prunus dulcis]
MAGQSDPNVSIFSGEEVEFMAEDDMVEIVPNMRMEPLNMLCGDFGPFYPQMATQVPMWLAIALKKRGKCTIRPPEWMSVENLTQILEAERESQAAFQVLPFHYVEISSLLFDYASGDIPDLYMVRSLINDIRDARFLKVESSLESFEDARSSAVKVKNLSAMEVNVVRPFVGRALQSFYKHGSPDLVPNPEAMSARRPQATDNIQRRPLRKRVTSSVGLMLYFLVVLMYSDTFNFIRKLSLHYYFLDVSMYFPESSSERILFKKEWMDIWIFLSGPIRFGHNMPHVPSAPTLDEMCRCICFYHGLQLGQWPTVEAVSDVA